MTKMIIKPVNGGINTYARVQQENLKNACRAMADSILNTAMLKAPKLTGALRDNGRVEIKDTSMSVVFGDKRVPYARRRHYENRKNPQTLHYLENAGNEVARNGIGKFLK